MKSRIEALCLLVALAVSVGCANNVGGTKDPQASYASNEFADCSSYPNERSYRNPFLKARQVGEAACEQ